jgi:hypothetical protein
MTKAVDYRKIIEEFDPSVSLLKGFDRHILSVNLHRDKIEIFYSLFGVSSQIMSNYHLNYDDCLQKLMLIVQKEKNANKTDVTYFFYDDFPNPQLN